MQVALREVDLKIGTQPFNPSPAALALRGARDESLALRIDPETDGFQYRDAQQWLFLPSASS